MAKQMNEFITAQIEKVDNGAIWIKEIVFEIEKYRWQQEVGNLGRNRVPHVTPDRMKAMIEREVTSVVSNYIKNNMSVETVKHWDDNREIVVMEIKLLVDHERKEYERKIDEVKSNSVIKVNYMKESATSLFKTMSIWERLVFLFRPKLKSAEFENRLNGISASINKSYTKGDKNELAR